ncbi:MAG: ribosome maturation factor RimP [Alphaproteobacteria bacterium]
MRGSRLTQRIAGIVGPSIEAGGFELVRVQLVSGEPQTLQIMAERLDGGQMNVEHCAEISRLVSALLDVEDPISGAYTLEVSSPGIERPLVKEKDFARFAGYEARLETTAPVDGRRRFRGRLGGIGEAGVRIAVEGETAIVPFDLIDRAKLVMTDELLKAGELSKAGASGTQEKQE